MRGVMQTRTAYMLHQDGIYLPCAALPFFEAYLPVGETNKEIFLACTAHLMHLSRGAPISGRL